MLALVAACTPGRGRNVRPDSGAAVTAIVNATVIPMDTERLIADAVVVVRGDRIVWVGSASDAVIPAEARLIDAGGGFVLPGLADLHVHTEERELPLYLQNGVTTIREMNGSPAHLALRERLRSGALTGPTMHVAGTLLAGTKQRWRHRLISTPDEARAAVRQQADSGYEFIKVYDGLSAESYAAIVEEAHARHIRVIGHVPAAVELSGVLTARQAEIEHVEQLVRGIVYRDTTRWRSRIDSVAREISDAGTWVNPTLAVEEALSRAGTAWYAERLTRPEMRFVDSATMAWWASLSRPRATDPAHAPEAMRPDDDFSSPRARAIVEMKRATVAALRASGVRLLMGTDLPNPLMVPGFSVHEELAALVRAGLTPFEAVATATRDAGEFMGGDRFGVIAPGARADLIIVGSNPLEDVGRLAKPKAVAVRGRWVRSITQKTRLILHPRFRPAYPVCRIRAEPNRLERPTTYGWKNLVTRLGARARACRRGCLSRVRRRLLSLRAGAGGRAGAGDDGEARAFGGRGRPSATRARLGCPADKRIHPERNAREAERR